MTDGLVQQDAGPAGAKHNIHDARRRRHGTQVDAGDAQGFAGFGLPVGRVQQPVQPDTPAATGGPAFAAAILFDNDRYVHPRHRAHIADRGALWAQNLDLLDGGRDRGRNLHDTRIKAAGEIVDLAQGVDLDGKGRARDRIFVGIELLIGRGWRIRPCAASRTHGQPCCLACAAQGGFGDLGRVGIARDIAPHRPQAKAFGGIVAGRFQPPVVKHQPFRPPAFEKQFPVVGTCHSVAQDGQRGVTVKLRLKGVERRLAHKNVP